MTIEEIKQVINTQQYSFLKENEHLGENIILLGLGGSHAYGTNIETSDLDIRGVALNRKMDILTNNNFEQFVNEETDTTIYSFNKMIALLSNLNPNTCEILGLKKEHYLYLSPIGQELLDNTDMFLSQKCIQTFGGYANSQLYRLKQKSTHAMQQSDLEKHILKTIESLHSDFNSKYSSLSEDQLKLYIDKAVQEGYDTEIFMDVRLTHYPVRDYCSIWNELQHIVTSYNKIGMRNSKAIEHGKVSKHAMHLLRLQYMLLDILKGNGIITYREKEHELLMDIRNGKYTTEDNSMTDDFYEILHDVEEEVEYAKKNTSLPEKPNYKEINEFMASVNEIVVKRRHI